MTVVVMGSDYSHWQRLQLWATIRIAASGCSYGQRNGYSCSQRL